jgi:FMN phosphatase YigB (HAD superfamily)
MSQPQAVIFDIGNVLTRWQPEAFYDRVIGPEDRRCAPVSPRSICTA